jgi:hypothetical protein
MIEHMVLAKQSHERVEPWGWLVQRHPAKLGDAQRNWAETWATGPNLGAASASPFVRRSQPSPGGHTAGRAGGYADKTRR